MISSCKTTASPALMMMNCEIHASHGLQGAFGLMALSDSANATPSLLDQWGLEERALHDVIHTTFIRVLAGSVIDYQT